MIHVQCSHCAKLLKVPETLVGQIRKCPSCHKPVSIPAAPETLPTLQPVETVAAEAAIPPPVALNDQDLAKQLRQQAAKPGGASTYESGRQLIGNASHQGAALYQRASRAVLNGVQRAKQSFQARQLRRDVRTLEEARERKLLEAGTAFLEQGSGGLPIDVERQQIQTAMQQINQCQKQIDALGGTNSGSSLSRDLKQQIARHSGERDRAVAGIGLKAHAAGRLEEPLRSEVATLDSMLETHGARLAALVPEEGQARPAAGDRFEPRRLAFMGAAVLVVLGTCWLGYRGILYATQSVLSDMQVVTSLDDEEDLAQSVGLVVCGEQVVLPDGKATEFPIGTGTAFAVTPEGHLLTNKHVVEKTWNLMHAQQTLEFWREKKLTERTPAVWVFLDGKKFAAEILHVSNTYDLAVLKIERDSGPYFRTSALDELARGTSVHALGFPGASRTPISEEEVTEALAQRNKPREKIEMSFKESDYDFVLTSGAVSRIRVDAETDQTWIQHNADINPGNSGGPLVTVDGLVVGINTLGHKSAAGIFYSLTLPQLRDELEEHVPDVDWE